MVRDGSLGVSGFDVESDLGDAAAADVVEHGDHRPVRGGGIAAEIDGEIFVEGEFFFEELLQLIERDRLFFEEDLSGGVDGEAEGIGFQVGLRGGGRREIDADGALFGHGEADHHEACEEEEHDIDERHDLEPSLLLSEGGDELHFFWAVKTSTLFAAVSISC